MRRVFSGWGIALAMFLIAGCGNSFEMKEPFGGPGGGDGDGGEPPLLMTYADVRPTFENRCSLCHNPDNGGFPPNWMDEETAKANRDKMMVKVFIDKVMPKIGPKIDEWPAEERDRFRQWIEQGINNEEG